MKYLFYISEYKEMLIQILISQKVPIGIPLKNRIDKQYQ